MISSFSVTVQTHTDRQNQKQSALPLCWCTR